MSLEALFEIRPELVSAILIALGVGIGTFSATLGIGGGFFFTPFFDLTGMGGISAVATSMGQIPFVSGAASIRNFRAGLIDVKETLLILTIGTLVSQGVVSAWPEIESISDTVIKFSFSIIVGGLGIYGVFQGLRQAKKKETFSEEKPSSSLKKIFFISIPAAILFGIIAALLGVGGGFVLVPLFLYVYQMPAPKAVGTSLAIILVNSSITTVNYFSSGYGNFLFSILVGCGALLGGFLGSKISQRLPTQKTKLFLGAIQITVVLIYLIIE